MSQPRCKLGLAYMCLAALGCASTATLAPPDTASPATDDERKAQQLAPDLYARALRARAQAAQEQDPAARQDHALRAELLLAGALAEAKRIELDRARAQLEARASRAQALSGLALREQLALEQASARAQSARAAHAAMQQALSPPADTQSEDATTLLARARLLLAAALSLAPIDASAASTAIERAEQATSNESKHHEAAHEALAEAQRALGQARATQATPRAAERATLRAMASEYGLHLRLDESGAVFMLDGILGSGGQLSSQGRQRLSRLAAVLRSHPHGPAVITVGGGGALAQRRARLLGSALGRELGSNARSRLATATNSEAGTQLRLPAYREGGDSSDAPARGE